MKKNILIIILIVIALGLGGFIAYDKLINKTTCPVCNKCDVKTEKKTTKITFDASKCINNADFASQMEGAEFAETFYEDTLSFSFDSTGRNVKIFNKTKNEETSMIFDKKVESVFTGLLSINMGSVYFFIMEDGTVEYMRYSDIYLNDIYQAHLLEEVSDVVSFENINLNYNPGSRVTTIAYKADGTFYDLSQYGILDGDGVNR